MLQYSKLRSTLCPHCCSLLVAMSIVVESPFLASSETLLLSSLCAMTIALESPFSASSGTFLSSLCTMTIAVESPFLPSSGTLFLSSLYTSVYY